MSLLFLSKRKIWATLALSVLALLPLAAQTYVSVDEGFSAHRLALLDVPHQSAAADSAQLAKAAQLDSVGAPVDTAALARRGAIVLKGTATVKEVPQRFVPDPQRALWLSLVLPGAGQVYNRKYWKLPLVYGGFLGCTYAFLWNQQTYMDYSQAYLDIMDSNPETNSFLNYFPPGYDISGRESLYQTVFKNRKDRYRRYRDLSAICFIGVYLLSVIDAYVDAQLSVFDISPDLSLRIAPTSIESTSVAQKLPAFGIGATLSF